MSTATILELSYHALQLVMMLSLPVTAVAAVVGLAVAILEAVTQIQEQAIGTFAKVTAVFLLIMFGGHSAGTAIYNFADRLFQVVASIGVAPGL